MKKTGEILKSNLGLSHLNYVYISRVLLSVHRIYFVFYDSRRPNVPITSSKALKSDPISRLYKYPFESEATYLPLINILSFNAPLENALFFAVDISGVYGKKDNKVDLKREGKETLQYPTTFFGSLQEYLTFNDLKKADVLGDITKRTRTQRNRELATENRLAKLVDINIDTVEDHITFIFKTQATTPIYSDDATFQKTNVDTFNLERNPNKEYELYLRVLNFFEWLKGTKPEADTITQQDVKDVLRINNVQVFSTSPSFHWQGANYNISQLDGSIYPTDIPPTVWKDRMGRDDYLLDKHIYGLIRYIDFFSNPMASMLTKRLRDRELI